MFVCLLFLFVVFFAFAFAFLFILIFVLSVYYFYIFSWGFSRLLMTCSVVKTFAHGAMGRRIDPSWGGSIELFLVPSSSPRLV